MNNVTAYFDIRRLLISCFFACFFLQATSFAQYRAGSKEEADQLGSMAKVYYQKMATGKTPPARLGKTDALSDHIFNGQATGDRFGFSVSTAGDVNGDGYADIIVGAPQYNSTTGRAYIFYGGPAMDNIPDVVLTGEAFNNYFGISVSSAGDVNGDGYADVIVGASGYGASTGRAYIYYGGSSMDNTADVTLTGTTNSDFGISVSTAGDVNGDGYADVIVGAYAYSGNTGRAYIYYGGSNMDTTADVTMTGEAASNDFGYSVSTAGDVNGDGYADVIVGAFGYSGSTGRAYIYYGSSSMNNIADVTMTGEGAGNNFGISVSTAGDVNGDGYGDVVVGANGYNSYTGRAYVYYGGSGMNNTADVTMTGEGTGDSFGYSVSTAGDVNGDGYADVIVGENDYNGTTGRANIYYGGSSMDNAADITMTGEISGNDFGYSVCGAGDVNGDGYDDVVVGAYQYSASTGRVYVYKISLFGTDMPDESFTGEQPSEQLGYSVSAAGDVNGDGYPDVIVGAIGYNSGTGRAYIYYGGPNMNNIADLEMTGEAPNDQFGVSVSTAGDVNGDGYADVIVGAPGYSGNRGRAYIYYGGPSMDTTADVTMTGEGPGDYFGISVSTAGDVNGDGYADAIVGAIFYSGFSGRAYIYYGGSSMDNIADVTMTGAANNQLGVSVSTAGDVNGDGYADVIVGAMGFGNAKGRAYIYYGGSNMNNVADVTLTGQAVDDLFGVSVSTAGDVNGDGYADVIVGALGYNSLMGRAYIYYGGSRMDSTADVILTGQAAGDGFGGAVSPAGDVNGDGYADVIVGAYGYNNNTGRAYIYYGGSSMDNLADVTMTGEAEGDFFGVSVSTAGDMNEDGYADVLVGAMGYSSATGRAYLYRSSSPPIVPHITSVKDVPFDQGGKVTVNWIRSAYDAKGVGGISSYTLERSLPPGSSGYYWEQVASVTPRNNPKYSYTCAMPYDSMTGTKGTYFFRVTAQTSDVNHYWRSNIISGHSVDNIPPAGVGGGSIAANGGGNAVLSWDKNRTDKDLKGYTVYRSTSTGFALNDSIKLAQTTDTTYTDISTIPGNTYYYRVAAVDVHGNIGMPTGELSEVNFSITLTSFTASQSYRSIILRWKTATETSNAGFEIERRTMSNEQLSMNNWSKAGFVDGSGTANTPKEYSFTDSRLEAGKYSYRLKQIDRNGDFKYSEEVEAEVVVPKVFALSQNYPNPFNPTTTIEFTVPSDGRATLKVYDILGREVATLLDGNVKSGVIQHATFDASRFSSGIYFSRLEFDGTRITRKMTLLK